MHELVNKRKKMAIKRKKKEDGLTFTDFVITTVILAVVLISIFRCSLYGFNALSRMRQMTIATQSIQDKLELIRNMPFDDILSLDSSFTNENFSLLKNSNGNLSLEDHAGDDIKKLTVSILWSCRGRQMQKDMFTYVTRKGINKK